MLSCYALACSIVLCSPSLHASYTRLPSRHYVCLEWSSHFSGSPALVACVPLNSNAHSPSSPPLSGATLRYRSRPRSTCTLHVMTPRGHSRTVSLPTAVYPRGQSTWYVVPVLLQLRHRYVPTTPRQPSVSVTALLFGHSLSPRYHLLTAASLISIQQRLRIVVHRLVDVRSVPSVPYATRTPAYTLLCLPGPVVHNCTSVHSYLLHTVQLYSSLPLYQWEPSSLRYATRHSTTALSRYTATMAYGRDASHPLVLRTRSLPLLVLADARPPYAPSHRLLPSTRSSKSTLRLLVTLTYRTSPLRYNTYRSHLRYLDSSFSFVVLSALPRDSRLVTLRSALSILIWEIG